MFTTLSFLEQDDLFNQKTFEFFYVNSFPLIGRDYTIKQEPKTVLAMFVSSSACLFLKRRKDITLELFFLRDREMT